MKKILGWMGTLAISVLLATQPVSANNDPTGNPLADGWTAHGNSLDMGTYIRGVAGFSFDVYTTSFTLAGDSTLLDGYFWQPGDQILGLGGVNLSGYIYEPRVVAKFGSATSLFSASTLASPNGNGNGSFSGGDGGLGSVQVDYEYQFNGTTLDEANFPGQNGGFVGADNVSYYNGSSTPIDISFGNVIALFQPDGEGRDVLQSFEAIIDLTALGDSNRFGAPVDPLPVVDGTSDLALQENLGNYTDALVPEPSTYSLVLITVPAFGWMLGRRRRAKI